MQGLQLLISNLLHSHRCRGNINFVKLSGSIMIWLGAAVPLEITLGTVYALQQSLCQEGDQATGFGDFDMLKHSFTIMLQCGRPK